MYTVQQGIVTLLKSAVTGQTLPLPEDFSPDAALELIRRHNMATLCYEGAVLCGISRKTAAMKQLLGSYGRAMLISEGQLAQLQRVTEAFEARGIEYMLLKGSRMKRLYPKPELRTMGDADILIRMEQYEAIRGILPGLGFEEKSESDHELVWQSAQLYLELHKHLIPSYNQDYYAFFGTGWKLAAQKNGCSWSMTAESEFVYLFTHFAKHYRDGGIGCRHAVDLWVYLRAHPELDEAAVRRSLERLQLLEFYGNVRALLSYWFEDGEGGEKQEHMTRFLFASGSWGDLQSNALSQAVRDSRRSALSGRSAYVLRNLFPPVSTISGKYPVLKKAPWLLPGVWVYRLGRKLLVERDSVEKKRLALKALEADAVQRRQELLRYVGLDFHFD